MTYQTLTTLDRNLAGVASTDRLTLDARTLGDQTLADYLFDLVAGARITVASEGRSIAFAADGASLAVTGKIAIGRLTDIQGTLLFFESRVGADAGSTQLELLVTLDAIPSITIDQFGPEAAQPDPASRDLVAARRAAFLKAVTLTGTTIAASSYDFTLAAAEPDQAAFAVSCSLADDPARAWMVNGINLDVAGVGVDADILRDFLQAGASGAIWDEIDKLATGTFAVRGAIELDIETGERSARSGMRSIPRLAPRSASTISRPNSGASSSARGSTAKPRSRRASASTPC